MELVKKTEEFSIFKKKNNRFCVKCKTGKFINAEKKSEILQAQGLISAPPQAKKEEAPVAEAATNTEEAAE